MYSGLVAPWLFLFLCGLLNNLLPLALTDCTVVQALGGSLSSFFISTESAGLVQTKCGIFRQKQTYFVIALTKWWWFG